MQEIIVSWHVQFLCVVEPNVGFKESLGDLWLSVKVLKHMASIKIFLYLTLCLVGDVFAENVKSLASSLLVLWHVQQSPLPKLGKGQHPIL